MFESGREALPNVGRGLKALPEVREWLGDPPKCPGVVGRHSWMMGRGRKAFPNVWEWSGDSPDALSGREAHLDDREWSLALSDVREW